MAAEHSRVASQGLPSQFCDRPGRTCAAWAWWAQLMAVPTPDRVLRTGEFAAWVAHVHAQPCHVVYTNYRPTPLQHYAFPAGGRGLSLVGLLPTPLGSRPVVFCAACI